tara:strand:+ start:265 stop:591 length:327 start_codon:yes stop_codon:yes gene_type:complete
MNTLKFNAGEGVKYKSQSAAGIDMRKTTVVGFQDEHENLWEKRHCDVAKGHKPRRVNPGTGKVENRYVIEHYFGWNQSNQQGLNEDLELSITRRYQFAFESELTSLSE